MGILLDILCIGLLAASAVVFAQKSVSSSLLSLGALLRRSPPLSCSASLWGPPAGL